MKEKYKPYVVCMLVGIIAGFLEGFLFHHSHPLNKDYPFAIEIFSLQAGIVASTFVIVLSYLLSTKFNDLWKISKSRLYYIISMFVVYVLSYHYFVYFLFAFPPIEGGLSFVLFWIAFIFLLDIPSSIFFPIVYPKLFLLSNALTIPAAYVATKGISQKRIKYAILVGILISFIALFDISGWGILALD